MVLSYLLLSFLTKSQTSLQVDSVLPMSSYKPYDMTLADSLYNQSAYSQSALEYERIYFFSRDTTERINALLKQSECYGNLQNNYKAYSTLVRAITFNLNDSIIAKINYKLAFNLYMSKYFFDAERYCAKNYSLPITSDDYKHSILLHALILNELNNFNLAHEKAIAYCNEINLNGSSKDSLKLFVNSFYEKSNIPKLKSLKKARRLSKCLPGAGLFYVGKPGKALVNISLQLFAVGYTAANVYCQNYFTSATVGVFLMRMFYTGGVNQLNEIVPKVNYLKTRKFNDTFKTNFITQLKKHHAI